MNISAAMTEILAELSLPPTADELSFGWSQESKEAALAYFEKLNAAITSGQPLPPLGIVRGLDHWGVVGGKLLESIAKVTNAIRRGDASDA